MYLRIPAYFWLRYIGTYKIMIQALHTILPSENPMYLDQQPDVKIRGFYIGYNTEVFTIIELILIFLAPVNPETLPASHKPSQHSSREIYRRTSH